MTSLYEELSEKIRKDPGLTKRGGARADLGLLLFNAGDSLRELWNSASLEIAEAGYAGRRQPSERLKAAVEKLRPMFGERKE